MDIEHQSLLGKGAVYNTEIASLLVTFSLTVSDLVEKRAAVLGQLGRTCSVVRQCLLPLKLLRYH